MSMTTRSADGTTIAYQSSGSGPAVILVGGALNSRHSAGPLATELAPHFTVYAYDRRGRGQSTDSQPYAVAREVEDLQAVIDAAGDNVCVYGHSSGAILALEAAAADQRVSRLAVYEPPYLTQSEDNEAQAGLPARLDKALAAGDRGAAVEMFIRFTGADFDEAMTKTPWWPALLELAHTLPYDVAITGDGSVPAERLAAVTAPTLALYGGASPAWAAASAEAVVAAVPGARAQKIDGQDHAVAADVLAPVLIGFFR
ncbi:alpha/beta fold hydrolase [Paenarthrobacter sp. DKR-5]|uniref:alpha/beta fold hydrolase n=1 Tax=Paenarthrobacter sp. DKR-5 TaxID=2835535 RepID=UPI001BDD3656|nr:alpha/beta hydrolase [Paenarthrobacter sp. DKR-5]MBT1001268.1 alpha/beta fold hydrolase [Paenarthrobacter sp. DKR-5]